MSIEALEQFAKGGPYYGPKGGKYADPQRKIAWKDREQKGESKKDIETSTKETVSWVLGDGRRIEYTAELETEKRINADGHAVTSSKISMNETIKVDGKIAGTKIEKLPKPVKVGDKTVVGRVVNHTRGPTIGITSDIMDKINEAVSKVKKHPKWEGKEAKEEGSMEQAREYEQHSKKMESTLKRSMDGISALDEFSKGGPYYGPRGGKWQDPQHKIPWDDKAGKKKTGKKQKVAEGQLGLDFSAPAPKKTEPKKEPEKPKQAEPQTKHEKAKARKQEKIRSAIATDEGLKDVFSKMALKHGGSFFYPYDLPNKIGIAPEDSAKFIDKLAAKGWIDVRTTIQGPKGKEPTKLYQFTSKGRETAEDHVMGKRGDKEPVKEALKEKPKQAEPKKEKAPKAEKKTPEVAQTKKKQVLEKPQYDVDFSEGFKAGKAAHDKDPYTDATHAEAAYEKVSSKHGGYYEDGFKAAIDHKRGAYAGENLKIARHLGLVPPPTLDWKPEDEPLNTEKSMGENDMSGIDALNDFAKGGPYIGPKGGKWADPQHKIPWIDRKGKKKDKGDPTGSKAVSESVMGMIAGKDPVKVKRENQESKRKIEPVMQAMSSSAQKAIKHMSGWGGVAWTQLNPEMQGKLKKLGVVRELANGNYALNEKGKAMAAKIKKSEGIDEIMDFAKGSLPSGEPKMGSGEEQGGKLEGKGKTSGSGDSASGPAIGAPTPGKDKFSEDDEDEKKAMKEHKKPLEQSTKSFRDTTPQGQRDAYALEHAQLVSRLKKGEEDERVSVSGAPRVEVEPEAMAKSRDWNQGSESRVTYSNASDDFTAELAKSEAFYHGGAPRMSPHIGIMHMQRCAVCGDRMSKALTACPHCGEGTTDLGVVYVEGE